MSPNLMAELTDKGGPRFGSGGFQSKSPTETGLGSRPIQKGPETICDLGTGVPNHSELEPGCGVPHGLGGAMKARGVSHASRKRWSTVGSGHRTVAGRPNH
jgi:hypothetical protein